MLERDRVWKSVVVHLPEAAPRRLSQGVAMALAMALIPTLLWWRKFEFQPYLIVPLTLLSLLELAASALAFGRVQAPRVGSPLDNLPRALVGAGAILGFVTLFTSDAPTRSLVVVVAGLVAGLSLAILRPELGSRATGALDRLAGRSGAGAARVLTLLLLGPIIVLVWLVHRVVRFNPLKAPTAEGDGWVRRRNGAAGLIRGYAVVMPAEPVGLSERFHRAFAGFGVLLAMAASVVVLLFAFFPAPMKARLFGADPFQGDVPSQPAAAAEEPWYDELAHDLGEAHLSWRTNPGFMTQDVASPTVNIVDGERRTWTPPECECERLEVWVFGGSSVFGLWQRDAHTIASELARAAWEDGIALEVSNFGQPAYTLWQEVWRLSELLATSEVAPDVVLFMDGANEFGVQTDRNLTGFGTDETPSSALDTPMRTLFPRAKGLLNWNVPGYVEPSVDGPDPLLLPEEVAGHAVDRYLQSKRAATILLDGAGSSHDFTWQPIYDGSAQTGDAEFVGPSRVEEWWTMRNASVGMLPADVTDYSDLLSSQDQLVFYDLMHLNERGAKLVANEWYGRLQPLLEELMESHG